MLAGNADAVAATTVALVLLDQGVVVASGPPDRVLGAPNHARTRAFLSKIL
jgi:polar amino acid transport system ATP-binding protein